MSFGLPKQQNKADLRLHTKGMISTFLRLAHFRVALLARVLRRIMYRNQMGIHLRQKIRLREAQLFEFFYKNIHFHRNVIIMS